MVSDSSSFPWLLKLFLRPSPDFFLDRQLFNSDRFFFFFSHLLSLPQCFFSPFSLHCAVCASPARSLQQFPSCKSFTFILIFGLLCLPYRLSGVCVTWLAWLVVGSLLAVWLFFPPTRSIFLTPLGLRKPFFLCFSPRIRLTCFLVEGFGYCIPPRSFCFPPPRYLLIRSNCIPSPNQLVSFQASVLIHEIPQSVPPPFSSDCFRFGPPPNPPVFASFLCKPCGTSVLSFFAFCFFSRIKALLRI